MNKTEMLNTIIAMLQQAKDDNAKLQHIYEFMMEEIYEKPEEEEIEIPEKYKKLVHDIAENVDCGYVCFLNTDTMEHIDIPSGILDDLDGFDDDGLWQKDLDKVDLWKNVIQFKQPHSSESFKIMKQFANHINDEKFQDQLINILERNKPFANFKNLIDNSDYRQDWFKFKQVKLEEYVFEQFDIN